jgi:hypothetical protein
MELHNALTARPDYVVRLLDRFGPENLGMLSAECDTFDQAPRSLAYLKALIE